MQNNPYVGPRPYTRADRNNFYGRNREARDLLDMLIAERVVLFYAQSGAGKSSLLNAKVIPDLEARGFRVLPPLRVSSEAPPGIEAAAIPNIFVFSTLLSLADPDTSPAALTGHTLLSFLRLLNLTAPRHSERSEESQPGEESQSPILPVLIWDQFEELFTTHRDRWEEATGFFEQVAAALESIPELGVVFVMREDHIAAIEPYAHLLPRRLRARFRMERLGYGGALEAIRKPALHAGYPFAEGVAEQMVDNLRRIKAAEAKGQAQETALGPYVEPVQLQVVCHRLWENLPEKENRLIRWEEVTQFGDVDQALTDFYEETLQETCQISKEGAGPAVTEHTLRHWFGEKLITPMQTRGLVLRGAENAGGLPNAAVDALEAAHIIRAEVRAGARWYELCHDRLVEPVLASNRAWEEARQTPLRMVAHQWQETGDNSLLYHGAALKDALRAIEQADVEPYERDFVAASRQAEQARLRRRRLTLAATGVGVIIIILMAVLTALAVNGQRAAKSAQATAEVKRLEAESAWATADARRVEAEAAKATAEARRVEAEDAKATAEAERTRAEEQARIALSRQWASQAQNAVLNLNPDLALLLAIESLKIENTLEAQAQLRRVLAAPQATQKILAGHTASVRVARWDPTESFIATGAEDGTVALWDGKTGEWLRDLNGHEDRIRSMEWAAGGAQLLTASSDATARIWDATTGEQFFDLEHPDTVYSAVWSADRRYIATACRDGAARVWDATTGDLLLTLPHPDRVVRVAWYDYRLLTGANDGAARIWDLTAQLASPEGALESGGTTTETGEAYAGEEPLVLEGHAGTINGVAWSPDGQWAVTAGLEGLAYIWNTRTGQQRFTLAGHTAGIQQALWSPDGLRVLTVSDDGTARVWDAQTGAVVWTLVEGTAQLTAGAWSPDGTLILTAGADKMVRVWDARTGELSMRLAGHWGTVRDAQWRRDGLQLLSSSDDYTARLWDLASAGRPRGELPVLSGHVYPIEDMVSNRDKSLLLTSGDDGTARVWDTAAGALRLTLTGHEDVIWRACWSPDESRIATASNDGTACIWDARSGERLLTLAGHAGWSVDGVSWNAEGTRLLTFGNDFTARVWNAETGEELVVFEGHTSGVRSGAWSPVMESGARPRILTAGDDRTARVWDAETGEELWVLEGHTGTVWEALWSADGRTIVTISDDGTACLWDAATGETLRSLAGHTESIYGVKWSPDGRQLLTASADRTARIWDAGTGAALTVLQGHGDAIVEADWSADGRRVLTAGLDGTARLWDAETGHAQAVFTGHNGYVARVEWSADESRVFTAGEDGDVRQFYVGVDGLLTSACQQALRNMTAEEWEQTMQEQGPYRATCPNLPGADE
ncbi:MAG: hypothetical protein JXA21_26810 [Anaerolineae bacterium]|nr:hypothetical protein [Anaerolineae bacterium]